ncbi:hypothetical protein [Trinickia mobilis]|uniref:hypothetical protein n=1 Tax=Trinickia mobilis TaxID=2816356 RepID=UPI001A8E1583|nr:hypothetical protein [Trinickia mobilis]
MPQAVSGFLTRVIVPDETAKCTSVVTQAFEGPPSESPSGSSIMVILDIDVFRVTRIDDLAADDIWSGLDVLRDQKNRMFFEHLTEKTVEMYE